MEKLPDFERNGIKVSGKNQLLYALACGDRECLQYPGWFFYVYFYINFYNVDLFMMLKIVLEALSTLHLSARSALTISIFCHRYTDK